MSLAAHLETRRAYLDTLASATSRLARVALVYLTTNQGELVLRSPVAFGIAFMEEPSVASGVAPVPGVPASRCPLVAGHFPNCSAGVWAWQRNPRGDYVGAYLYFVVDSGGQPYNLHHHLTFEGVAMRLTPPPEWAS